MKKSFACFILLISITFNLPCALAADVRLPDQMPFCNILELHDVGDISHGVIVDTDNKKCYDIDHVDLSNWLNTYWNFSYDRVIAPLQDSVLSGDYIKLWNKDKSQSYTVFPNGGIIVGEYGESYESQGITKQNYVWYLPIISNSRNALNSANETLKHIYFYKTYEGYKDRSRDITQADEIEIPSNNLLIIDTASRWAHEEIKKAAAYNLMVYDLSEIHKKPITRYDFCRLAYRMIATEIDPDSDSRTGMEVAIKTLLEQKELPTNLENTFSDCYYIEAERLASMGIIEGMGDGTFAPELNITREQAATILYRMADVLGKIPYEQPESSVYPDSSVYEDLTFVSDWATTAVLTLKEMGIMNGVIDSIFLPKEYYTTEQAIATMVRLYEYN